MEDCSENEAGPGGSGVAGTEARKKKLWRRREKYSESQSQDTRASSSNKVELVPENMDKKFLLISPRFIKRYIYTCFHVCYIFQSLNIFCYFVLKVDMLLGFS